MTTLRERLLAGDVVYGPFWKCTFPGLLEAAGNAGWDFAILDMEHGSLHTESIESLIRAAELTGISSVIRVPEVNANAIGKALDLGANGVLVPNVATAGEAAEAVQAARFPPTGQRGADFYTRVGRYGHLDKAAFLERADAGNLVAVQVEGLEGVQNLPEILQVEGLDLIFVGPYDLSKSVGVPGQVTHPEVVRHMEAIVKQARDAGKIVGNFVESAKDAHRWRDLGVQFIAYSVDIHIFYQASKDLVAKLQGDGA